MIRKLSIVFSMFMAIGIFAPVGLAQTTAFTYQGSLSSGGGVANGNHDFEFALFDAVSGGAQLGATLQQNSVAVTNGIFAVSLDFGSQFPGAGRFLEIRVRPSVGGAFTPLTPRQQITSAPYSVKSLNSDTAATATNATQLGGVAANQYLQTNGNGSGLTNLNAGSITTGTLANERLGQIPTANIADNAVTAAKVAGGQVVKGVNGLTDNVTLAGSPSITITPSGNTLTFTSTAGGVGGSGTVDTIPLWSGSTALGNSVITQSAGKVGIGVPSPTAKLHIDGTNASAGLIASHALGVAVSGSSNLNIGVAGQSVSGEGILGQSQSNSGVRGISQSGPGVLGNGVIGVSGFSNSGVGVEGSTSSGIALKASGPFLGTGGATITGINGDGAVITARRSGGDPFVIIDSTTVSQNSVLAFRKNNLNRWLAFADNSPEIGSNFGSNFRLDAYNDAGGGIATYLFIERISGRVGMGIGNVVPTATLDVNGTARVRQIPLIGSPVPLCFSPAGALGQCGGSSLRLKTNVNPFSDGLNILRQLRPISYTWKEGGAYDIGLGAEDVAKVAPFFASRDKEGVVEGVRYERLNMLLINAVNQQQEQIQRQQQQIDALKTLVCASNREAVFCKEPR